ncbi:TonB-dependent receptor [Marichromatium gracile]|uniref:TonB-dependent receptor n=1 Tax=Marichromatium gracile TaxID=1048 RepID=UPI001F15777D|nr:TonB-dependent receptor [Marichromatium gracile]MCF1183655.1 TonB-dependent receptor [Marichromatium gracile]
MTPPQQIQPLILALVVGASGLTTLPVATHAAGAETGEASVSLSTITVTARRGEEQAKEIPFGLSVLGGEQLEEQRLDNLEEVLATVPGVDISGDGGPNNSNVRIRGVGSLYQLNMDDNSVVLNVDGVSMSTRNLALGMLDIERIEVLKGPQGTLFGRNSEAGAINVTTRKPTRYFEGHVRGEVGELGRKMGEAVFSGPISEQVSARVAYRNTTSDLWVENSRDGEPLMRPHEQTLRGTLLWEIGAGTEATLVAERYSIEHQANLIVAQPYGDQPANDLTPGLFDDNERKTERYSLEISHDLAGSRLSLITSLVSTDIVKWKAYDRTITEQVFGFPGEVAFLDTSEQDETSQELRWSSLPDAPVFWVTGLHLSQSDRTFDTLDTMTGNFYARDFSSQSAALFGELTYPLGEALKLTGGVRHSWDEKDYEASYRRGATVTRDERDLSDDYTTGRLALSYALSEETNLYGLLARGHKSGGFNDYASSIEGSTPYDSASVNTLELGFKHESLDGRFTLNGALFFNRVKDDHLLGYDAHTFAATAINADTESKGAELEGRYAFDNGLSLAAALSYTDAQITSDAVGVSGGDVDDGNRVPEVPRWGASLSLGHVKPLPAVGGLGPLTLNTQLSYRFVGERPGDPQNTFDLDAYQKLDLRVGLAAGNAELYLWADNLLDEDYDLYAYQYTPTLRIGAPARGRTVGLGVNYFF